MTDVEAVARTQIGAGVWVDQLLCHPRLPLIAGLDAGRPAVHVWDHSTGELREVGIIGSDSRAYGEGHWMTPRNPEIAAVSDRRERGPAIAWHPDQALLLVAGEGKVTRWTPDAVSAMDGLPPGAAYRAVAFSPDGQTVWASPSSDAQESPGWPCSDAIDLDSGNISTGRYWDTGVAVHPSGELVTTLRSDQGATLVIFARADQTTSHSAMRVLSRALMLDADGYQTPVFSADGRHLAIRGNAYENSLEVFEFPSLTRVLGTVLGDPHVSGKRSPEWYRQFWAWSRRNIAFAKQPGVLWVGTPDGTLIEIDLDRAQAAKHDLLTGGRVTALASTATGDLVIATGEGELVLASVRTEPAPADLRDVPGPQALAAAFVNSTTEAPDGGDLEEDHLVITDGTQTWEQGALQAVTDTTEQDPAWLQHRAAINRLFAQDQATRPAPQSPRSVRDERT
jgi:WD40 repeat protein